jgi:FkbM family methyltransferase
MQLQNRFNNTNNFIVEGIGLDDKKGESFIYEASHDTISSMSEEFINIVKEERFNGYNWGRKIPINVDTLDNMIIKHGKPNYIKIDVEGYELNVLKGLTQKIDLISIEFTPELCKTSIDCIDYLEKLNGKCKYNYGYREDTDFKFEKWLTKNEILEYITSINDYKYEFGDIYIQKLK